MRQFEPKSIDELDSSANHLLHRSGQVAAEVFAEEMVGTSLTPRQYAVLLTVGHRPDLSQTDLALTTGVDQSTLADIVGRLERKHLLVRERTKVDQRAYSVRLTEAGARMLAECKPNADAAETRILDSIPEPLREPFLSALRALVRGANPDARVASGAQVTGNRKRSRTPCDGEDINPVVR